MTKEIHKEVVIKRQEAGEVVDKHVAINKAEGEKLSETVRSKDSK